MLLRQMTGALGSTLTSIAFYTILALFIQLTTGFESNILDTYTAWHSVKQYLSAPAVEWTLHKSYGLPHAVRRIRDRFASTRALRRRAPPPVRPAANLLRPPRRPLGASESKEVEL